MGQLRATGGEALLADETGACLNLLNSSRLLFHLCGVGHSFSGRLELYSMLSLEAGEVGKYGKALLALKNNCSCRA